MITNVLKVTCDRCKNTVIKDEPEEHSIDVIPSWLVLRQAYANGPEMHLCTGCRKDFDMFMKNYPIPPRITDFNLLTDEMFKTKDES